MVGNALREHLPQVECVGSEHRGLMRPHHRRPVRLGLRCPVGRSQMGCSSTFEASLADLLDFTRRWVRRTAGLVPIGGIGAYLAMRLSAEPLGPQARRRPDLRSQRQKCPAVLNTGTWLGLEALRLHAQRAPRVRWPTGSACCCRFMFRSCTDGPILTPRLPPLCWAAWPWRPRKGWLALPGNWTWWTSDSEGG